MKVGPQESTVGVYLGHEPLYGKYGIRSMTVEEEYRSKPRMCNEIRYVFPIRRATDHSSKNIVLCTFATVISAQNVEIFITKKPSKFYTPLSSLFCDESNQ